MSEYTNKYYDSDDDRSTVLDEIEYQYQINTTVSSNQVEISNPVPNLVSNIPVSYKPDISVVEWLFFAKIYDDYIKVNHEKPKLNSELDNWFKYNLYYYTNNVGVMKNTIIKKTFENILYNYNDTYMEIIKKNSNKKLPDNNTVIHNVSKKRKHDVFETVEIIPSKRKRNLNKKKVKEINNKEINIINEDEKPSTNNIEYYHTLNFTSKRIQQWNNNYEIVQKYIDEYGKTPTIKSNIENAKYICDWIRKQNFCYKNKNDTTIVAIDEYREKWKPIYDKFFNKEIKKQNEIDSYYLNKLRKISEKKIRSSVKANTDFLNTKANSEEEDISELKTFLKSLYPDIEFN